jgi:putative cardiolipin synthase
MRSIVLFFLFILSVASTFADEVSLLVSRKESYQSRVELIRNEKKELRLSTFTFDLDDFGKETLGHLVDAAKRGVKVTLNIDGLPGTLPKNAAALKVLEEAGVEVKLFNPVYRNIAAVNYRNHMKSLIGSDSMILGDRNMTSDYFNRKSGNDFIGMDVLIKGDQVNEAKKHFDRVFESKPLKKYASIYVPDKKTVLSKLELEEWLTHSSRVKVIREAKEKRIINPKSITYYADSPGGIWSKDPNGIHGRIIDMINRANKTLEFTNPYVLLTVETKKALQDALNRGVKIKVNSNSVETTDSKLMSMAWDSHKDELLDMGIEVHELKKGHFLHAKTIVRDNAESFIGSFNLDPRSQNLNLENGVFIVDDTVASRLDSHNRRLRTYFMTKTQKTVITGMTATQKTNHCVRKSLRRYISSAFYPIL